MPLRTELTKPPVVTNTSASYTPYTPVKTLSKTSVSHLFDDFGKEEENPVVNDLFYDFSHKHDKPKATVVEPVETDDTEETEKPKAKSSAFGAVWRTVASTVINYVRQNLTPGLKTEEEVAEMQTATPDKVEDLGNSTIGKFLVSTAKQSSERGGMTNLAKVAEATNAPKTIKDTYTAAWTSGTKLKAVEKRLSEKADLANQSGVTRFTANVLSSMPISQMTKVPVLGYVLMGNMAFRNSVERTIEQMELSGEKLDNNTILINALGNAAIDIETEMLFGQFGKLIGSRAGGSISNATKGLIESIFKKSAKQVIADSAKTSVKALAKGMLKTANEEGMEEVLATAASGILAKLTTEKDLDWLAWKNDGTAAISVMALLDSYATGAVAAGLQRVPSGVATFNNIRKASTYLDKPIGEVTVEDYGNYIDAVKKDMKMPSNQKTVTQTIANVIESANSEDDLLKMAEDGKEYLETGEEQATQNIANETAKNLFDGFEGKQTNAPKTTLQGATSVSNVQSDVTPIATQQWDTTIAQGAVTQETLIERIANKEDVSKDVNAWIETDEGKVFVADVNTSEDVMEKISDLKTELQEGKYTTDKLGKINLQLLAYKSFLAKITTPEGQGQRSYLVRLIDAVTKGKPTNIKKRFDKLFSERELLYNTFTNRDAVSIAQSRIQEYGEQANSQAIKLINELYNENKIASPDQIVEMFEYTDRLVKENSESADYEFGRVSAMLSEIATRGGQQSQAFRLLAQYLPASHLKKLRNKFDHIQDVPGIDKQKYKSRAKTTAQKLGDINKKFFEGLKTPSENGTRDVVDNIDDPPSNDAEDEMSWEQLLAKRIEKDINKKPMAERTDLQKALSVLFAKYKETNPSIKKHSDIYKAISDIIINRTEYARVWDEAKTIVEGTIDITDEQKKTMTGYFDLLADPVMAERVINKLVTTALKDANINMNEEAKRYLSGKESSIDTLMQFLETKMPSIYKSGLAYIRKYVEQSFDSKRSDKSQALIDAYFKAQEARRARLAELESKKAKAKADRISFMNTPAYAAKSVAKQIEAFAKITVKDKPVNEFNQKLIKRLMSKANEVLKRTQATKENPYQVLSDIISNRKAYSSVWNSVQDVLKNNPDLANRSDLAKYFSEMADPISANKYISQAVSANIKSMNKSVYDLAKQYFFTGNESVEEFVVKLRENMPDMDEQSFAYLDKYVEKEYKKEMEHQRDALRNSLNKRLEKGAVEKQYKSEQEMMIEMLSTADYRGEFDSGRLQEMWAKRLKIPIFTQQLEQETHDMLADYFRAKTQTEKDAIYDKITKNIAKEIKATNPEKVTAFLMTAMLLNMKSLNRNAIVNFAGMIPFKLERRIQHFAEKRAKLAGEVRSSADKYLTMKMDDPVVRFVKKYVTPELIRRVVDNTDKMSIAPVMGQERTIFNSKLLEAGRRAATQLLKTGQLTTEGKLAKFKISAWGDTLVFENYFKPDLANLLKVAGFDESLPETKKAEILRKAVERASETAKEGTYRNHVWISNMINKGIEGAIDMARIKELESDLDNGLNLALASDLRKQGQRRKVLLKMVYPFVNTLAAITSTSYKYSPLAMAKVLAIDFGGEKVKSLIKGTKYEALSDGQRAIRIKKLAQSVAGTSTSFVLGFALAGLGILTGAAPDNEKEKQLWALQGKRAYSIYIKGLGSFSIDWMQPVSPGLIIGAQVWQSFTSDETLANKFLGAGKASIDSLLNNSIFDNQALQLGMGEKNMSDILGNIVTGGVLQGLPQMVKQLNKVIDPYQRDLYSGTAIGSFAKQFMTGVPFGTFATPIKTDIWGEPATQVQAKGVIGVMERTFINMFSPFLVSETKLDHITKEVAQVFEASYQSVGGIALPPVPSNKIAGETLSGKKHTWDLNATDYAWYVQRRGELAKIGVQQLINNGKYRGMTDDEKANALSKVYTTARETANAEYIKKHPKK